MDSVGGGRHRVVVELEMWRTESAALNPDKVSPCRHSCESNGHHHPPTYCPTVP
jgi:hypothetical protein